jgi:hypothetical protein
MRHSNVLQTATLHLKFACPVMCLQAAHSKVTIHGSPTAPVEVWAVLPLCIVGCTSCHCGMSALFVDADWLFQCGRVYRSGEMSMLYHNVGALWLPRCDDWSKQQTSLGQIQTLAAMMPAVAVLLDVWLANFSWDSCYSDTSTEVR